MTRGDALGFLTKSVWLKTTSLVAEMRICLVSYISCMKGGQICRLFTFYNQILVIIFWFYKDGMKKNFEILNVILYTANNTKNQ